MQGKRGLFFFLITPHAMQDPSSPTKGCIPAPWIGSLASQPVVCVCLQLLSFVRVLSDPTDCSPPGFSVCGIFQARILERVTISSSRDLPDPGIEPACLGSPALAGRFFIVSTTWDNPWSSREVSRRASLEGERQKGLKS